VTRELHAPKGRYSGRNKVYCSIYRDWNTLCQNRPGPMRRCYIELADNPFPPMQTNRHHQLKGKLKGFWEYEVGNRPGQERTTIDSRLALSQ